VIIKQCFRPVVDRENNGFSIVQNGAQSVTSRWPSEATLSHHLMTQIHFRLAHLIFSLSHRLKNIYTMIEY